MTILTVIKLLMFTGKQDQLKNVDAYLWESEPAPRLCPAPFRSTVDQVLQELLGMSIDDVTHKNCRNVYLKVVHQMSLLVADGSFRLPIAIM